MRSLRRFWNTADPGFTLVELLIVMALIAMVVVTAIPRSSRSDEHLNVESMVLNLRENARYAINLASDSGRPVRFVVCDTKRYYSIEIAADSQAEVFAPVEGLLRVYPEDVLTLQTNGFQDLGGKQCLIFSPRTDWPIAELTILGANCGKRLKIQGIYSEVEDLEL
ncbi:MAG TPA: type II secretion system protein [Phycisphaerae bacterium]|jgi:prepilin-type N-terminal cleavage/methylation domain-containing protein|nr:type II secretion system protein [Phycisphaerae bacterium]